MEKTNSKFNEQPFRRAVLDAPLPIMIHAEDGEVLSVNRTWTEITGYSPEEIPTIADWTQKAYGSRTELVKADIDRLYKLDRRIAEGEYAIATKSGETRIWEFTSAPLGRLPDSRRLVISMALDITSRKQSEEALSRSYQRLEALQEIDRAVLNAVSSEEIARAALLRMHRVFPYQQAVVALFNFETGEARILAGSIDGVSEGETISLEELMSTAVNSEQGVMRYVEDIAILVPRSPIIQRQLTEGRRSFLAISLVVEKELIGELALFANQPAAFNLEHQAIAQEVANQLAVAIQQARQREQLQSYATFLEQRVQERTAALEESNADMEAFTYSVSHDLREPVRVLQGFAQILLEDYADQLDSVGQDFTRRILTSAQRMEALLRDLLSYSHLSRTELVLQRINLNSLVKEVLTQLEVQLIERQAVVTVEEPLLGLMGQHTILVQVVTNLLTNAIKFVARGEKPVVRIWTQKCGQWVRLWVEDRGIGIEPKHQKRIFQVFERLHGTEVYPGTGIGLAIVRRGVERMGGQVGVESALAQGSRFWIELLAIKD
jgi:PAS domain S-box-containing protein